MRLRTTTSLLSLLCLLTATAHARDPVTPSLLASADAAVPGETFTLGIRLKMAPQWHTYWINPGESGQATSIKLSGPDGFEFGPIQWPLPHRIDAPGGISYGYEDEVLLMVPVRVPKDAAAGRTELITADISWLACKEECIKGSRKLGIAMPVAAKSKPENSEIFDPWRKLVPVGWQTIPPDKAPLRVEQPKSAAGVPQNELVIKWKEAPAKVEWFPVASSSVAIEDVKLTRDGATTRITFKPTVFKDLDKNRLDSVLVYEDKSGRRGVTIPFDFTK